MAIILFGLTTHSGEDSRMFILLDLDLALWLSGLGSLDSGLGHSFGWLWRIIGLGSFFWFWIWLSGLWTWSFFWLVVEGFWSWVILLVLVSGLGLGLGFGLVVDGGGLLVFSHSFGSGSWFLVLVLDSGFWSW